MFAKEATRVNIDGDKTVGGDGAVRGEVLVSVGYEIIDHLLVDSPEEPLDGAGFDPSSVGACCGCLKAETCQLSPPSATNVPIHCLSYRRSMKIHERIGILNNVVGNELLLFIGRCDKSLYLYMNSTLACLVCANLRTSRAFNLGFKLYLTKRFRKAGICEKIVLHLYWSRYIVMDSKWSYRIGGWVRMHQILEDSMSWLSTLGGGFSALGENSYSFAHQAGRISWKQFRLAKILDDVIMQSRARLYFALSLMQVGRLKLSREIIYKEYRYIVRSGIKDERLKTICQALWNKLNYHRQLRRNVAHVFPVTKGSISPANGEIFRYRAVQCS